MGIMFESCKDENNDFIFDYAFTFTFSKSELYYTYPGP